MQIHSAAARGDIKEVERLLKKGVDVDARTPDLIYKNSPLMVAAASPSAGVDMLRLLAEHGARINAGNNVRQTALSLAIASGSAEKVRFLLEAGADVSIFDMPGMSYVALQADPSTYDTIKGILREKTSEDVVKTFEVAALQVAVRSGDTDVLRLMLDAGAELSILEWTALMREVAVGTVEGVRAELANGADWTATDFQRNTAWQICLQMGDPEKAQAFLDADAAWIDSADLIHTMVTDRADMAAWMLEQGADPNYADEFKHTALQMAAENGATNVVNVLLNAGADVNAEDFVHSRPISDAANIEVVKLLVEAGADIDYVSGEGYTRLRYAAESGDADMVRGLLALGAGVDAASLYNTPLLSAVRGDHLEIVEILLAAGADPNVQTDPDGWFPLQDVQSIEVAKGLLDAGADIHMTDGYKDALASQNDPEIARFLIEAGARVNPTDEKSRNRLLSAVENRDMTLVKFYLEAGAEVNAQNSWGLTALMEAAEKSLTQIVAVLLSNGADVSLRGEKGRTALFHAAAPEAFTAYNLASSMPNYSHSMLDSLPDDFPEEKKERILEMEDALEEMFKEQDPGLARYGYVASDSVEVVRMLVKAGADLNARAEDGMTPLILAASCGRPARVKALLALGADKALKDNEGKTALDHAREHPVEEHRKEIVELLS